MKKMALVILLGVLFLVLPVRAGINLVHQFAPSNIHGSNPNGDLVSDDTYFYGMGYSYGQFNCGTIFRINSDGSGFLLLHAFAGGGTDGRWPLGSLIISGTTLYGMTFTGGDNDLGTIFKLQTDGTGFTLLHEFAGGTNDGAAPYGSLVLSGTTLYGMTYQGGYSDCGTIFKIDTAGTGFTLLREFVGGAADGAYPYYGSLLLSGSTLYGTTVAGGDTNNGTIFKMETNGTGFALLHEFAGGTADGAAPIGALILSGTTLYGMTRDGGDSNAGTIFKIDISGTGFTRLHTFLGGADDGDSPQGGSLTLSGTTLYGMTYWGGDNDFGVVFKMETSGTGFILLREFAGSDGAAPFGSLIISGSTLYGMTKYGGGNDSGTIFKIGISGEGFTTLLSFAGVSGSDGGNPRCTPVLAGTTLYGTTLNGGGNMMGTIFKVETNGSGYTQLHEFALSDGANPYGSLIISGLTLYGMTYTGGDNNKGTIFKIGIDGSGFTLLHSFAGGTVDGAKPYGSLIISGSTLYGMTTSGGFSETKGTIFKIETNGTGYALLHEFAGGTDDGAKPYGSLILSGSTLYGMTYSGGYNDLGTVFKIGTAGSGFTLLHEFAGGAADGSYPKGDLLLSGSVLYGMTFQGGESNNGTIFKIGIDGTGFTLLRTFAGGTTDGKNPNGSLILSGPTLYGMTPAGGSGGVGMAFKIQTNGTGFTSLHEFPRTGSADGRSPFGSLLNYNNTLFGTTNGGGSSYAGVVFSLPVPFTGVDFIGTWDGQGVYYRNSTSGAFVKLSTPATLITAGDLDGDGIADLIGIWPSQGGVWIKYSQSGSWAKLSSTARDISAGDMNGDGRVDLVASWDGQGVYYRNSLSGAWVKMATPATQVTAGDLDGDGKADIVGIWPSQGGVWVKYSQSGSWAKLSTTAIDIACGDMNGDGRDDLVATWDGQGVYYRNSLNGAWVKLATPATLVTAGDLDGDGKGDTIGIWPGQGGVWVKYSQSGSWAKLSSSARHIAAGLMRGGAGGSATLLAEPAGGIAEGPGQFRYQDLSTSAPGGSQFKCREEKNLMPQNRKVESARQRVPGPGEYGFQCLEQNNLVPDSEITKESKDKEQH